MSDLLNSKHYMFFTEQYFKDIFNTAREALLVLDENLTIISANHSFFNMFKVDTANTIGRYLYDLGDGQWNIPALRLLLEDILPENATVDNFEIEHNFENIGQKTMLLNASKIIEEKSSLSIILLAIEDMTEHKRLESLLTESEERYRRLFETASDGIVLLEKREETITHTNPAAEKMLGYNKAECIGNKLQNIGISLDMSDFQTIMQSLNKNGIINFNDVPVKTKSGQYIDTDIYMVDRSRLIQCNIRDITERKRTETEVLKLNENLAMRNLELEEVNSELESFIYSISHDLRAPIRHMSSFARFLLEDYADKLDDQGKDYLKRINKGSDKTGKLIDDLLNLSRLSRQELSRTEVDMSALAASIVSGLREADPGRSVEISIEDGITASADPSLTEIVLSNLIGNAWKFTSKTAKARIEFGTIEKDGKTIYYVRDNGAGFNFQYATEMFQPFHRLHSDEDFEGTGIGLAIVEQIIRRHGGKVWAEGRVDRGASVCFTLG